MRWTWLTAPVIAFLCACGASPQSTQAPWRADHPDPAGITFDESAPGICAITVRYPDLAPSAVDYRGNKYIQEMQTAKPAQPQGSVIGQSGDWAVSLSGASLYVVTGSAEFTYRMSTGC